jgi:hypothetical protein
MRDAMGSGSRSFLTRSIGNALASSIPLLCIVVCDPIHKSVSDLAGENFRTGQERTLYTSGRIPL